MLHQREMLFRSVARGDGKVTGVEWNPITDDGDALRLATRLHLVVAVLMADAVDSARTHVYTFHGPWRAQENHGNDADAATRRAIVRAAAAMDGSKS